jgi:hypothetical protein
MSSDVNLDYLPEGFRDGGRGQYEAADLAAETARGIGRINASGNHFGGGTAGAFASALNHGAADRSSAIGRAAENRADLGDSSVAVAGHGEDIDLAARQMLNGQSVVIDRSIADGI